MNSKQELLQLHPFASFEESAETTLDEEEESSMRRESEVGDVSMPGLTPNDDGEGLSLNKDGRMNSVALVDSTSNGNVRQMPKSRIELGGLELEEEQNDDEPFEQISAENADNVKPDDAKAELPAPTEQIDEAQPTKSIKLETVDEQNQEETSDNNIGERSSSSETRRSSQQQETPPEEHITRMTLRNKQSEKTRPEDGREDFTDQNGYDWKFVREMEADEDFDRIRHEKHVTFATRTEARIMLRCKRFRRDKGYQPCPFRMLVIGNPEETRTIFEFKKHNHAVVTRPYQLTPARKSVGQGAYLQVKTELMDDTIESREMPSFTGSDGLLNNTSENFVNRSGTEWIFVSDIDSNEVLEEFIKSNQCVSNGTKGNSSYFRCQRIHDMYCPYKMLLRRNETDQIILYSKGEHNHEIVPIALPSPVPDNEQVYVDKLGRKWLFFRSIYSDEDLAQARREHNAWMGSTSDTAQTYRCGNHAPKRGSCPHRMILVEEGGIRNFYTKGEHNHTVVPNNNFLLTAGNRDNSSTINKTPVPVNNGPPQPPSLLSYGGFKDARGNTWNFVRVLRSTDDLNKVRGQYQCSINKRNEKSTSLRCTRWNDPIDPCPLRMLYFYRSMKLYQRNDHNHETMSFTNQGLYNPSETKVTHSAPKTLTRKRTATNKCLEKFDDDIPSTCSSILSKMPRLEPEEEIGESELIYTTPKGDPYSYVCSVGSQEELETIRCQKQVYHACDRDNTSWYRCSFHTMKRGLCPYRILVIASPGNGFKVYQRNQHNHAVMPITPSFATTQQKPAGIDLGISDPFDEFDESFEPLLPKLDKKSFNSAANKTSSNAKKASVGGKIKPQGVPEFRDRDGHKWEYFCMAKGGREVERVRREQQAICKGRKGIKRYFRCQLYVEGSTNCSFRLVAVEGPNAAFTIYTDNHHNHPVIAIDENAPTRHSQAKSWSTSNGRTPTPNYGRLSTNLLNNSRANSKQKTPPPPPKQRSISRFTEGDLAFRLTNILEELNRLASDLLLLIQEDRDSIIFMSREEELSNQILVFTDEGDAVNVAEFHDTECTQSENWPKAGFAQFISAARGKCFEFFFETPLSVSRRTGVEVSSGQDEYEQE